MPCSGPPTGTRPETVFHFALKRPSCSRIASRVVAGDGVALGTTQSGSSSLTALILVLMGKHLIWAESKGTRRSASSDRQIVNAWISNSGILRRGGRLGQNHG